MELITELIGSLGFPIAICVCLIVYIWKVQNKSNEAILQHSEALVQITKVVENNTNALQTINQRLDSIEEVLKYDNSRQQHL